MRIAFVGLVIITLIGVIGVLLSAAHMIWLFPILMGAIGLALAVFVLKYA